jgi:hypothetical protein
VAPARNSLICTVADLSELDRTAIHNGGSRLPWITVRQRRVPIGSLAMGALPGGWGRQAGLFQPMPVYLAAPAT